MSDIRFNNWKHQSGTGGVSQNSGGNVGIGSTLPSSALDVGCDVQVTGVVTATSFSGNLSGTPTLGTGVTITASGMDITGVVTATSFVGSGANLTGLPVSSEFSFGTTGITTTKNLGIQTSTVDNYESVGAANSFRGIYIGDGSLVFNARLDNINGYYIGTGRNALNAGPVTLGSTMTLDGAWVIVQYRRVMAVTIFSDGRIIDSNGINLAPKTVVDKWRLTGSVTGNQDPISSNLERDDSTGHGVPLGDSTGMTHSSGTWTFPSTGIWRCEANWSIHNSSSTSDWCDMDILYTVDNSNYNIGGRSVVAIPGTGDYMQPTTTAIIDVTDTSQVKLRLRVAYQHSSTYVRGNTTSNYTYFTFTRIADT